MRCVICDKCKSVIERPDDVRIITCSRPRKPVSEPAARTNEPPKQEVLWRSEVCVKCAIEIEDLIKIQEGEGGKGDDVE